MLASVYCKLSAVQQRGHAHARIDLCVHVVLSHLLVLNINVVSVFLSSFYTFFKKNKKILDILNVNVVLPAPGHRDFADDARMEH